MAKYEIKHRSGKKPTRVNATSNYDALKKINRIRRKRYGKDFPLTTRKGIVSIRRKK
jgi:hypothetical protein|tara:strand:- start:180 stop:350 length:171 start_codon:yes stop_codon:yes gene_type:complete